MWSYKLNKIYIGGRKRHGKQYLFLEILEKGSFETLFAKWYGISQVNIYLLYKFVFLNHRSVILNYEVFNSIRTSCQPEFQKTLNTYRTEHNNNIKLKVRQVAQLAPLCGRPWARYIILFYYNKLLSTN